MPPRQVLSAHFPGDVAEALRANAAEANQSVSAQIRRFVVEGLRKDSNGTAADGAEAKTAGGGPRARI